MRHRRNWQAPLPPRLLDPYQVGQGGDLGLDRIESDKGAECLKGMGDRGPTAWRSMSRGTSWLRLLRVSRWTRRARTSFDGRGEASVLVAGPQEDGRGRLDVWLVQHEENVSALPALQPHGVEIRGETSDTIERNDRCLGGSPEYGAAIRDVKRSVVNGAQFVEGLATNPLFACFTPRRLSLEKAHLPWVQRQ